MWEMIHGEAKQICCSARMDCTRRERTNATFQKQKPRYNDLQGTEAHAWCCKTKSSSLRDHNWSQTTSKEFSAALIESSGPASVHPYSSLSSSTGGVLKFPHTV
jgi:hypothetical protein